MISGRSFNFTAEDLSKLFEYRKLEDLRKLGGLKALYAGLKVDPEIGLRDDESFGDSTELLAEGVNACEVQFKIRRQTFGSNVLPPAQTKSLFQLILSAFEDKILIFLSIAALASLAIGIYESIRKRGSNNGGGSEWIEGLAIIIAVLVVVLVQSINDYQKELQFQKLNAKKKERNVKIKRNGKLANLSIYDVQVGDVMLIEPGDLLNVDGILISCHNLKIDESSITGESDLIIKTPYSDTDCKDPFILSGGKVNEGLGELLVCCIGPNSFYGKIMLSLRVPEEETPLQVKLDVLAEFIAKLGGSISILLFIVLLIIYLAKKATFGFPDGATIAEDILDIIIQAIIIIVVAVPEGLPLAVTLALAYATRRMMFDNNLVRVLASCETMGSATCICSDKTGTLTCNRMTVVSGTIGYSLEFFGENGITKLKDKFSRVENDTSLQQTNGDIFLSDFVSLLFEGISINSTAFLETKPDGSQELIGNKTETALLEWITKLGAPNFSNVRHNLSKSLFQVYPFSSSRKSMITIIRVLRGSEDKFLVYVKGASEVIIRFCNRYVEFNDTKDRLYIKSFSEEASNEYFNIITNYANQSLRTVGLAYTELSSSVLETIIGSKLGSSELQSDQTDALEAFVSKNLVCLGVVGIQDPLREGVSEAVKKCQRAGVFVRMVTGDNINTAKSIASKCGILMRGGLAIEGSKFRNMSESERHAIIPRLQVLARSSPTDKQILVKDLKNLGEIVAVTGDGTNDGPALKMADVGFSMGMTGTEVAKEASSIVLLDDNFASIIKAIMWGRSINDSVKKFLQFQLTVNISAVTVSFISAVSTDDNKSVLTAIQLLWINLLMDSLAALALATDPPTESLLERHPEGKKSPLISIRMIKMIAGQAIFQISCALASLYFAKHLIPSDFPYTNPDDPTLVSAEKSRLVSSFVFNLYVFFQFFNEINCRRIDSNLNIFEGIERNFYFLVIMMSTLIIQILIMLFGDNVFNVIGWRFPTSMWVGSVFIPSLTLLFGVVIRLLPDWEGCTVFGADIGVPDNSRVVITKERLLWADAIGSVKTQLSVFRALRGTSRRVTMGSNECKPSEYELEVTSKRGSINNPNFNTLKTPREVLK